jgi:predicted Fe-Mo cluster-binding NifX family protein
MADSDDRYIEVKVYANGIFPKKAKQLVEQGVDGVISGGKISDNSKQIFGDAGIWYRENVEPEDLEPEPPEVEGEN